MPPPPRTGGPPVTNIRNTMSPHWRGWLKPESRYLVPFNSFAEYAPEPNPETNKKDVVWFALNGDRPPTVFAGIWTEFKGDRGTKRPFRNWCQACSSPSRASASFKSSVSKPSVNQPWIGARRSRASSRLP
jgi:putative SOS response-associated peptidase YedK